MNGMVLHNHYLEINGNDPDEIMLRNTYLNGLQGKLNFDVKTERSLYGLSKKVNWTDSNTGKKEALIATNFKVDLYFQKDVKGVTSHKKLRPSKSIIKGRSNSVDVRRSNIIGNQQMNNYNNNQNVKMISNMMDTSDDKTAPNNRANNFVQSNNNSSLPPRSFSLDQKVDNSKGLMNFQPEKNSANIQIITPNVNSIINNNYNNIFIQSPTDMDFKKLNHMYSPESQMKIKSDVKMNNNPNLINNRLASAGRKDNPPLTMNNPPNLNSYNSNAKPNFSNNLTNNLVNFKGEADKMMPKGLGNSYDPKQIKVIDYSNNNFMPQAKSNSNLLI